MAHTQTRKRSAHSVLLRVAADQDRASRIRALKDGRPDLTWQAIADHVGVTMRAAQAWAEKGEIAYTNARKLADLFEVDVAYVMRGPHIAPDLMGKLSSGSTTQLDQIQQELQDVRQVLDSLLAIVMQREFESEDAGEQDDQQERDSEADDDEHGETGGA